MTVFHTCCETLHHSGGGENEGEWEEDSSGGLIGHSTGRRSLSTVGGDTRVSPNRGERSTRMTIINDTLSIRSPKQNWDRTIIDYQTVVDL